MKIHTAPQGTPEWRAARLGVPSASNFDRILTAKTRKLASGRDGYLHELATDWLLGVPADGAEASGGFVGRGTTMEDEARSWLEFEQGVTVERAGFCTTDDGLYGASPDGLIGTDGGCEFKCPSAVKHVANLLDRDAFRDAHYAQAQGGMLVCGRRWWWLVSYHPTLPKVALRIERDEEYLALLAPALATFCGELHAARARLLALGCVPAQIREPEPALAGGEEF